LSRRRAVVNHVRCEQADAHRSQPWVTIDGRESLRMIAGATPIIILLPLSSDSLSGGRRS
jgi:hypothetical protein